jgi:hypothetical protein
MLIGVGCKICEQCKQSRQSGGFPDFGVRDQGCQMVFFQTKNPNLGKFCRALEWKSLVYYLAI